MMKTVAVFCGSNTGSSVYIEKTRELAKELVGRNLHIVFGGGKVGLMGILADTAIAEGGKVTGVIPHFLMTKEVAHDGLDRLLVKDNMHQRKMTMHELCDAVIVLPGGFGTMEEFFEMLTWAQLGLHKKPIAILNVNGFYDGLSQMVHKMVDQEFVRDANKNLFFITDQLDELFTHLESYEAPEIPRWINPDRI